MDMSAINVTLVISSAIHTTIPGERCSRNVPLMIAVSVPTDIAVSVLTDIP